MKNIFLYLQIYNIIFECAIDKLFFYEETHTGVSGGGPETSVEVLCVLLYAKGMRVIYFFIRNSLGVYPVFFLNKVEK